MDSRWSLVVRPGVLAVFSKRLYLFSKLLNYLLEATKLERLNATLCQSGNVPPKTLLQQIEISGLSQLWHIRGNIH